MTKKAVPSGYLTVRHGKSQFLRTVISMGHGFHGYVSHNQMVNTSDWEHLTNRTTQPSHPKRWPWFFSNDCWVGGIVRATNEVIIKNNIWLVVSNMFLFPFHKKGCHPSDWLTPWFFRGVAKNHNPDIHREGTDYWNRIPRGFMKAQALGLRQDCNSMLRVLKSVESQWFAMSSGWWFGTWILWLSIYWE